MLKKILIVTGGSGGHVIPALSIFDHLKSSFETSLVTDLRGSKFIDKNKYKFNLIDVPNIYSKKYLFPIYFVKFIHSIFKSYFFLKRKNINFLISTGGYMSIPICIASKLLKIKIFLFEPNSVLGKSNKLILSIAKNIICYDSKIKLYPNKYLNKIYSINPIFRKEIYSIEKNIKEEFETVKKILIIGGSQGAEFFDKNIPDVVDKISKKIKIEVCQQISNLDKKSLIEKKYNDLKINYELFSFDNNLYRKINKFDLVITRSGSSTIAELAYFNVPFIAIPFPFAKDNHQYFNAKFYENASCNWLIEQHNFNINYLADLIINLFSEKTEYFEKKQNLQKIYNQNTWNNVNKKLLDLINEN
tara:strand:+ start:121 stop:1200 length:1080 start_codon:yes stop_codon:yes gene_type:complete